MALFVPSADPSSHRFTARFVVRRFNPEVDDAPYWQEFDVEVARDDRVLDALHEIKWRQDGTLTFRRSCGHGVCGSDAMLINGRNALACTLSMADAGVEVVVEPIRGLPVVKDLLVDMEPFFAQYRAMSPWLGGDGDSGLREQLQTPEERARIDDTTRCILCAACTTACPVSWSNGRYVGAGALVTAHRFIFDSRDGATAQRLALVDDPDGVWRCRTAFSCTDACPRGIKVTEAILEVRRATLLGK